MCSPRAILAAAVLLAATPAWAAEYPHTGANLTVTAVTLVVVIGTVWMHYIGLSYAWRRLNLRPTSHRHRRVLYGILFALMLHIAEIWLFGFAYWLLGFWPAAGQISQIGVEGSLSLLDAVYFSATTYSTAGYGDLAPLGPIRLIAAIEALVGFLLITWSASFTYLEMDRNWRGL